ncbi:transposase [Streptomyces sp. NBC_00029]|uniref:transposase n=1 Tax=Streptomyces sp. NBC_00029 TaxID=2903613 RepID=UPI00386A1787
MSCRPGDAEWKRLRLFLPVSSGRCGRWRDHRQVIDGVLHPVRTGVQWRDLPERFGPWKTIDEHHHLWSAEGTGERPLQQVQATADAAGETDWDISVDSTRPGTDVRFERGLMGRTPDPIVTAGQRDDCTHFPPVLEKMRIPRIGPGRPRKKPDSRRQTRLTATAPAANICGD